MIDADLRTANLAVGAAYFGLTLFIALARLSRADRLSLPPAPRGLWLRTRLPMLLAALLTVIFAVGSAIEPPVSTAISVAWMAVLLTWTLAVTALDASCRSKKLRTLPAVQRGLLVLLIILFGGIILAWLFDPAVAIASMVVGNIIFALVILMLIENIMRNAEREILWHVSLPGVATGGLALVSLLLYGGAVLRHRFVEPLMGARLALLLMLLPLFAMGAMRAIRWRPRRLQLSKDAAFYSASLILGGSFMLVLGVAGEMLSLVDTHLSAVVVWAILFAGLLALAILASSGSARSRLMLVLNRHFVTAPYDYRQEWLRCIATLSSHRDVSVAQRAIKALADSADSPSGVLLIHDRARARLHYSEGWNTALEIAAIPTDAALFTKLATQAVVELDPDGPAAPFWLAVALPDPFEPEPLGVVLLNRPRAAQKMHPEMVALLTVVAGEISLLMAERRAAEALAIARRFEETGKRFAFVAHDIKNVANQLGMLIDNAQRHITDPAFQADLIGTVRDSVDKIRVMIRRLDQDGGAAATPIDVGERLQSLLAHRRAVQLDAVPGRSVVSIDPISFDMIINHLIDNAREASEASAPGQTVNIELRHDQGWVVIRIIDQGCGMSAHFVRETLFKPFSSTKPAGFGLGAFQTRELLVQAGGGLDVVSDEGIGTTMTIRLPTVPPTPISDPVTVGERYD